MLQWGGLGVPTLWDLPSTRKRIGDRQMDALQMRRLAGMGFLIDTAGRPHEYGSDESGSFVSA
jgi:hypothetical protein